MLSRTSIWDHITVQLAPRAADELWYCEVQLSTIWPETSNNARSAARSLVLGGGLSEKHHGLNNLWVADRTNLKPYLKLCLTFDYHHLITWIDLKDIDVEALRILNMCYDCAKEDAVRHGFISPNPIL
ncbi:hypothetical protein Bca4012_083269 [Brassica carinata]|uniref:Uncharacterized protein n=1 Tax=Brassica carinata TaxID=52824 RepID=A0A8X7VAL2_BRACI|nr:hypothetical protein Bca52824_027504 [Brassica carinata]